MTTARRAGMATMVVAALTTVLLVTLLATGRTAGSSQPSRSPPAFMVPSVMRPTLAQRQPASALGPLRAEVSADATVTAAGKAFNGRHGMAVVLVLAVGMGLVAQRRQLARCANVVMKARGSNYLRPNAKGQKPLIHRGIAQDFLKTATKGWQKKYRTPGDIEDIMKKTIYGKVQIQFASKHFTDKAPWIPLAGGSGGQRREELPNHMYDDATYVRKFLQPAKFKKLEIAQWEMPANYTKACTLQELVNAGVQYGHASGSWNPKMLQYLYADYDGTHIFDLVQTAANLNRACYYVMQAASKGAKFFFTGTKEQAGPIIEANAERCSADYTSVRFVGGLFTNFFKCKEGMELSKKLMDERHQGAWRQLPQEVIQKNESKCDRLWRKYRGCQNMEFLPDILIAVDEVKERNAIAECTRLGIPVICLCDSNSNPDDVDIVIPGNASGSASIDLMLSKLTEAILVGQSLRAQTAISEREVIEPQFDPWIFSKDRLRYLRRRSKRQPWHKTLFGSYEEWKRCHPFGNIPDVVDFHDWQWDFTLSLA